MTDLLHNEKMRLLNNGLEDIRFIILGTDQSLIPYVFNDSKFNCFRVPAIVEDILFCIKKQNHDLSADEVNYYQFFLGSGIIFICNGLMKEEITFSSLLKLAKLCDKDVNVYRYFLESFIEKDFAKNNETIKKQYSLYFSNILRVLYAKPVHFYSNIEAAILAYLKQDEKLTKENIALKIKTIKNMLEE